MRSDMTHTVAPKAKRNQNLVVLLFTASGDGVCERESVCVYVRVFVNPLNELIIYIHEYIYIYMCIDVYVCVYIYTNNTRI